MKNTTKNSRRSFVKKLATGALAAGFLPTSSAKAGRVINMPWEAPEGKYSANDKIRVAAIGMGIMGFNNCETTVKVPGVELIGVCDLYDGRMERAKEVFGKHLFTTRSYEEVLARSDVDAVIIELGANDALRGPLDACSPAP